MSPLKQKTFPAKRNRHESLRFFGWSIFRFWHTHSKLWLLPKLRYFIYRLLNCKLTTNYTISKWKVDQNAACSYCLEQTETYTHLFWECNKVQKLWKASQWWSKRMLDLQLCLEIGKVLLLNQEGPFKNLLSTICLVTMQYICAEKCKQTQIKELNFQCLLTRILELQTSERIVSNRQNRYFTHYAKWYPFIIM